MRETKKQIREFIRKLADTPPPRDSFNQYSHSFAENSIRRNNLSLYLENIVKHETATLLVGEAPGYRGCRLTGVPFTSEFILLGGIDGIDLFGEPRGYRKTGEFERVWRGPSSTIMWNTLSMCESIPLLWNAFPFHPHERGNPLSNRTPTAEEVELGEGFIRDLIRIFRIEQIVAVGNKAESTLENMGVRCRKVRHPSHGGKKDFVSGINHILSGNDGVKELG